VVTRLIRPEDLVKVDALKDLSPQQRDSVGAILSVTTIPAGRVIFAEGEPGDAAYFILEGAAEVVREGEDGAACVLAQVRAGWIVGEMSLLDRGPRSATVTAVDKCRLAQLTRDDFETLVAEHPVIACLILRRLGRMLSLRLRRTSALVT